MEIIIVGTVILIFTVLNWLPFIAGTLKTPSGSVFLGTMHWPGDYFSYLSQFAQGSMNWFYSYDLYTSDFHQKTLVGWVNVFTGRLLYLLGFDHQFSYQFSIIIFTITFLGVSYLLIRKIFNENKMKRMIAFFLFVSSNAFPKLVFENGYLSFSYYTYWFNMGEPFNRLAGVPHHLLGRTVISLFLLLSIIWWESKEKNHYGIIKGLIFPLLGFILASIDPVHWGLLVMIVFFVPLIYLFFRKERITSQILLLFTPSIFFFLGGLPMALYLKKILSVLPYSQLANWEKTQTLSINVFDYILGNGPVMVLAVAGLLLYLKESLKKMSSRVLRIGGRGGPVGFRYVRTGLLLRQLADRNDKVLLSPERLLRILVLVFPLLTIGLFFSPIPKAVSIVNARFLPATTTLFFAVLATEAISQFRKAAAIVIMAIVVTVFIPCYISQIQNRLTVDTRNAFYYISKNDYRTLKEAQKISGIDDAFLVIWPFNSLFPGISGRRVYEGHSLATTDYPRKELETRNFFWGDWNKDKMKEFLLKSKIDYVLTYRWTKNINEIDVLRKVYGDQSLAIYKVNK